MNKLPFLIFCFLALTASATIVDTYTKNVLLNLHNIERSCLGLGNLTWDATIAAAAQDWAEYLAENDLFKHSGDDGVGENIAEASIRANMAAFLFSLWAEEKEHFSNAKPYPNVSTDGDVVGHYTQIIWGRTYAVGCGVGYQSGVNYLVCQYKLAGNYIGNYVYYPGDVIRTPTGSSRLLTSAPKKKGNTRGANRKGKGK